MATTEAAKGFGWRLVALRSISVIESIDAWSRGEDRGSRSAWPIEAFDIDASPFDVWCVIRDGTQYWPIVRKCGYGQAVPESDESGRPVGGARASGPDAAATVEGPAPRQWERGWTRHQGAVAQIERSDGGSLKLDAMARKLYMRSSLEGSWKPAAILGVGLRTPFMRLRVSEYVVRSLDGLSKEEQALVDKQLSMAPRTKRAQAMLREVGKPEVLVLLRVQQVTNGRFGNVLQLFESFACLRSTTPGEPVRTLLVYSNWVEASPSSAPAILGADVSCLELGISEAMHVNAKKLVEAIRCAANGLSGRVDTSDSSSTISPADSLDTPAVAKDIPVAPPPREQIDAAIAADAVRAAELAAAASDAASAKRREFERADDIRLALGRMPALLKARLALLVGQDGGLDVPTDEELALLMPPPEPKSEAGWLDWGGDLFASPGLGGTAGETGPMPSLLTVPSADVEDLEVEFQTESWARACSVDMLGDAYPAVDAEELERATAAVQAAERARIMDEEEYARRATLAQQRQQPLDGKELMAVLLGRKGPTGDADGISPAPKSEATSGEARPAREPSSSPRVCASEVCPVM